MIRFQGVCLQLVGVVYKGPDLGYPCTCQRENSNLEM
jgi:hypothetical protein